MIIVFGSEKLSLVEAEAAVRDLPSEFINRVVAHLLKKLLIRLPERRRPRAEHATPATTTWSRPKTLDQPEQYLRQGRSVAALKRAADALSDTEAALRLQKARDRMFDNLEPVA